MCLEVELMRQDIKLNKCKHTLGTYKRAVDYIMTTLLKETIGEREFLEMEYSYRNDGKWNIAIAMTAVNYAVCNIEKPSNLACLMSLTMSWIKWQRKVIMAKMTRQEILDRFEEAVYTLKKLPPVTMPRCKSFWPDIIYSTLEILQQEPRIIRLRPSSEQLSRLDEVLDWTTMLTEIERKLIWYKAQRKSWKFICTTLGISRSSGNEKLNKALDFLSEKLYHQAK